MSSHCGQSAALGCFLLCLLLALLQIRPMPHASRRLFFSTSPTCPLDPTDPPPVARTSEGFLFYAPQFGQSNQLVALRNAAAWALLLNRTLVLPHLLGHAVEAAYNNSVPKRQMASLSALFDLRRARRLVAPLRVIAVEDFLALRLRPSRVLQVTASKLKLVAVRDDYFTALSLNWGPPLELPMRAFTPVTIRQTFGACAHHRQPSAHFSIPTCAVHHCLSAPLLQSARLPLLVCCVRPPAWELTFA